jgi:ribosomal protein S3AE
MLGSTTSKYVSIGVTASIYPINTVFVDKVEPIKVPVESANCNSAYASILLPALDFK